MALGQIIALVMVNKCVKLEDCSYNNIEDTGKVNVFHDNDADADGMITKLASDLNIRSRQSVYI